MFPFKYGDKVCCVKFSTPEQTEWRKSQGIDMMVLYPNTVYVVRDCILGEFMGNKVFGIFLLGIYGESVRGVEIAYLADCFRKLDELKEENRLSRENLNYV